ncbi:helix-turn-helix domain-containing protein [Stenotrophomonas nitritireducens]|uniref:helix-turn-helix domain-containing protein n=1 Tax=Stenotrophomonas nitritireducens TaxID=83617 RepID=UPI003CCFEEBB
MRMKRDVKRLTVSADVALQMGRAIDAWRRKEGMTQRDLSVIAQVSQGQISRILAGRFSYADVSVNLLCKAAGINYPGGSRPAAAGQALHRRLHAELDSCWDGTKAGADALIELLRAAGRIGGQRPLRVAAVAD